MELIDTFYERWNAFTAALQPLAAWLQDAWASITRIFKRLVKWARSVISTQSRADVTMCPLSVAKPRMCRR